MNVYIRTKAYPVSLVYVGYDEIMPFIFYLLAHFIVYWLSYKQQIKFNKLDKYNLMLNKITY